MFHFKASQNLPKIFRFFVKIYHLATLVAVLAFQARKWQQFCLLLQNRRNRSKMTDQRKLVFFMWQSLEAKVSD
jgi:hypothetical protein